MTNKDLIMQELRNKAETRVHRIIKYLNTMDFFTVDYIPEPPVLDRELYNRYVIPNYIRCGAIPKDKLIKGKIYIGSCRNINEAEWDGQGFNYQRTKFGVTYNEKIKHFMDANGNDDVFVPIAIKN